MTPVEVHRGDLPVVLAMPHSDTWLPPDVLARLNPRGQLLADTDWHLGQLYDGLLPGASIVRARFHRYLIDANRPPDGASLYPGQNTTGLIPLTDFDGADIWAEPPRPEEIAQRLEAFHKPYHAALAAELARVRDRHGVAILYDCHSIRSRIPRLFDGTLPDLNIGTADGASCDAELAHAVLEICSRSERYSSVLDGRFKGGWTTRHHGRPTEGVHVVQMELAQSTHLGTERPPFAYDPARADRLRPLLARILHRLTQLTPKLRGTP